MAEFAHIMIELSHGKEPFKEMGIVAFLAIGAGIAAFIGLGLWKHVKNKLKKLFGFN